MSRFIIKSDKLKKNMSKTSPYCISIDLGNQKCVIYQAGGKNTGAVPFMYNGRRIFPTKAAISINPLREFACEEAEQQEEFNAIGTMSNLKLLLSLSFGKFKSEKFPNMKQQIISNENDALHFKINFKDDSEEGKNENTEFDIPIQQALGLVFSHIFKICHTEIPEISLESTPFVICVSPSWGVAERLLLLEAAQKIAGMQKVLLLNSTTAETICFYFKFLRKDITKPPQQPRSYDGSKSPKQAPQTTEVARTNSDSTSEISKTHKICVADVGDSSIDISISTIKTTIKKGEVKSLVEFSFDDLQTHEIGGRDFTTLMVNYMIKCIDKYQKNEKKDEKLFKIDGAEAIDIKELKTNAIDKLYKAAEKCKRNMLISDSVQYQQYNLLPGIDIKMMIDKEGYLKYCRKYLEKINLESSFNIDLEDIERFECNGGGFRLQPISEFFTTYFNSKKEIISNCLNAEECFAEGAAYYGLSSMSTLKQKYVIHDFVYEKIYVIVPNEQQKNLYELSELSNIKPLQTKQRYSFEVEIPSLVTELTFTQNKDIDIGTLIITIPKFTKQAVNLKVNKDILNDIPEQIPEDLLDNFEPSPPQGDNKSIRNQNRKSPNSFPTTKKANQTTNLNSKNDPHKLKQTKDSYWIDNKNKYAHNNSSKHNQNINAMKQPSNPIYPIKTPSSTINSSPDSQNPFSSPSQNLPIPPKTNKLKILYEFNESGLLSILECIVNDKTVDFKYRERSFLNEEDINKIHEFSHKIQSSKDDQNKKEDQEYKISTLINEISHSLEGSGAYSPYIKDDEKELYQNEIISKYKTFNWSELSGSLIEKEYNNILHVFQIPIKLKEQYEQIDKQITEKRNEAKQKLDDFVKPLQKDKTNVGIITNAKNLHKTFLESARQARKDLNNYSPKTEPPPEDMLHQLDESLNDFISKLNNLAPLPPTSQ